MKILIVLLFGSAVLSSPAVGQTVFGELKSLKYRNWFLAEDPGTVAFLPRIGEAKYARGACEWALLTGGTSFFKLPQKGNYVFEIRNIRDDNTKGFVACTAYTIYRRGDAQRGPILLTRNAAAWNGGKYLDGQIRTISSDEVNVPIYASIDDLRQIQSQLKADLKQVDLFTKQKWHAWPDSVGEGSWDLRTRVAAQPPQNFERLLSECGLTIDTAEICLTVHLLISNPAADFGLVSH